MTESSLNTTTENTVATEPITQNSSAGSKKKRRRKSSASTGTTTLAEISLRNPTWAYIRLQHLISPLPGSGAARDPHHDLDAVTAQLHLQAALSAFLGLHGAAIPIDILNVQGRDVWIRVPAEDRTALLGAAGGWVSGKGEAWRVKGWSSWNANAEGRDGGQNLF